MRDRPAFDLFLISWLVLFLELACIRWFPSHVLFLTFFVNIVLLACFVGMSVGCLVARRRTNLIRHTPYWLVLGTIGGLLIGYNSGYLQAVFAVGNQAKPDVVYFGTESSITHKNPLPFTVPMELVGALFFVIITASMVGPGQEMGRAFNRVANRTVAYSANLLGSLVGIGTFAACSYIQFPPAVWFGMIVVAIAYLLGRGDTGADATLASTAPRPAPRTELGTLAALGLIVALTALTSGFTTVNGQQVIWSEYYRIDYDPDGQFINTNLISQQLMESREDPPRATVPYALPYLFQRDLPKNADGTDAWPKFKKILIISAGNGNDVSRALQWADPDTQIDAIEIDPVIQKLGKSTTRTTRSMTSG